jgi:hypothetical protein
MMERVARKKKSQNMGVVYSTMVTKPFIVIDPSTTSKIEIIPCIINALTGAPDPSFQAPKKRKRGNSAPNA